MCAPVHKAGLCLLLSCTVSPDVQCLRGRLSAENQLWYLGTDVLGEHCSLGSWCAQQRRECGIKRMSAWKAGARMLGKVWGWSKVIQGSGQGPEGKPQTNSQHGVRKPAGGALTLNRKSCLLQAQATLATLVPQQEKGFSPPPATAS